MSGPGDEIFCPSCGERIKRTANFCRSCGEPNRKGSSTESDTEQPHSDRQHETTDEESTEYIPHRDDEWPGQSWDKLDGWAGEPPKGHHEPGASDNDATDSWWAKALPESARNRDESTARLLGVASGLALLGIVILSVLSFVVLFGGMSVGLASMDANTSVTIEEVTATDDDETIAISLAEELPEDTELTLRYSDDEESLVRADDGEPIASFSLNTVADPDRFYWAGDENGEDTPIEDGELVEATIADSGDEILLTFDTPVEIADEEQAREDFSVLIEEPQDPIGLALLATAIGQLVGFAGLSLWYLRRREFSWEQIKTYLGVRFPTLKEYGIIIGAWILILILSIIVGLFLMELLPEVTGTEPPEPADDPITDMIIDDPAIVPLLMLFMFLIVGPAEELLFRGVIQGRLRERFSAGPAILFATLIFTLVHVITYIGAPAQVAVTLLVLFVTAIVLGIVYEYTKNIVVVSLLHGLHNSMVILFTYIDASVGMEAFLWGLISLLPL